MRNLLLFFLLIVFVSACKHNVSDEVPMPASEKEIVDALVEVNKSVVKRNRNHIKNFIKRTGWEMTETNEGIWFGLIEQGNGELVNMNDRVAYISQLRFIDGTYADESVDRNTSTINIGQGDIESGLEKGLMLMSEGDSAKIIVPPYLAHGNFGENGKIPPGAILIFDVKILKVSRSTSE